MSLICSHLNNRLRGNTRRKYQLEANRITDFQRIEDNEIILKFCKALGIFPPPENKSHAKTNTNAARESDDRIDDNQLDVMLEPLVLIHNHLLENLSIHHPGEWGPSE